MFTLRRNSLSVANSIAVDGSGGAYVVGTVTNNVFAISSSGVITEIIGFTGDGEGNVLISPTGVAVNRFGSVYVAGHESHNVFEISSNGVITKILDSFGDGEGNTPSYPWRGICYRVREP